MRKDPTEFRKRFAMYKEGKKPYEAGRPVELPLYDDGTKPTVTHELWKRQNTRNALNLAYRAFSLFPQGKVITNVADVLGISPDQDGHNYTDMFDGSGLVGNIYGTKHYTPVNNGILAKSIADIKNANVQKVIRPLNIIDMTGDMVLLMEDAYKLKQDYNIPHKSATINRQTMLRLPVKGKFMK